MRRFLFSFLAQLCRQRLFSQHFKSQTRVPWRIPRHIAEGGQRERRITFRVRLFGNMMSLETAALLVLSKKLEAIFPKDKDEDA